MVRKISDQRTFSRGEGLDFHVLVEPSEMYNSGRLHAKITVAPGMSLAPHVHVDEMESFYVAKGTCRFEDNGKSVHLVEGDVLITPHDQNHAIYNDSDEPVELIALIVSCKQGADGKSVPL